MIASMRRLQQERDVAPERLLRTQSTFGRSVMVSAGVSNLGRMVLILIDAGVNVAKINVAYTTREVLLTQTLLPVAREICAEFFIFQQ